MKIHKNLKWSTLIERINKLKGYPKLRYDTAYGSIYELVGNHYEWVANDNFNKEAFIREYANG